MPAPYSLTTEPFVCPPAILGDLVLFPDEAAVTLTCRTEGAAIHYTLDGTEPTEASPRYDGPFRIGESCVIRARAFKEGFPPSPVTGRTAHKLFFKPSVGRAGLLPGCRYSYHTANFKLVSQVEPDPPEATGTMPYPSIDSAPDEDHFAYLFSGYLDIPEDGIWSFATKSDDGTALWIDGVCVVNNDGSHSAVVAEGVIPLMKGLHPYKLVYFEDYEGQEMSWAWKAPGSAAFSPVPRERLFYRP